MELFSTIDLTTDRNAHRFEKRERVQVRFAKESGAIESREGPNLYEIMDALIKGSNGDEWVVSRNRFDAKYVPVPPITHGQDGSYDNVPLPVLAKQIPQAFAIARSNGGDVIKGNAMDWLLQYAPGDFGIVQDAKFRTVYHRLS